MGFYSAYEENINFFLQDYYDMIYDARRNRHIKRFPTHRRLEFQIKDRVYKTGRRPEINAYSFYDSEIDRIFITEKFIDFMSDTAQMSGFHDDRAAWIFNVELLFCAFHELAHLLIGHCQLSQHMRLAAVECEEEKAGVDIRIYQTMEADADMFAARRVAERVATMIFDGSLGHFGYRDLEDFYIDTLMGVRAFSFVLEQLEILEAVRQHNTSVKTGRPQRGCQPNESTHIHPPALARGYWTGLIFMEHMKTFFHIPEKKEEFIQILLSGEKTFGGVSLSQEQFQKVYQYILDGTFEHTFKRMRKFYIMDMRKLLRPYSRISLNLLI